jgi:hypothetical protein
MLHTEFAERAARRIEAVAERLEEEGRWLELDTVSAHQRAAGGRPSGAQRGGDARGNVARASAPHQEPEISRNGDVRA